MKNMGFSYNDLNKFQNHFLNKYQLIAVTPPKIFLFKGIEAPKQIFIQIINDHADCLLSIKAFLKCNYFCCFCLKGYMNLISHRCEYICKLCFTPGKCMRKADVRCNECNRIFLSNTCYENHKKKKLCKYYKFCLVCKKHFTEKNHICNHRKCKNCKDIVPITHHDCFIKPHNSEIINAEDNVPKIFIFYDFETFIQETNDEKIHKENLCALKNSL